MRARKISTSLLVLATLIIGLALPVSSATATSVKEVSAGWVHTYAATGIADKTRLIPAPSSNAAHLNTASTINVSFQNISPQEQIPIQAAVNIWSDNWSSSVPVNVTASSQVETSAGVLASASAVNYFNNFPGAPDQTVWYSSAMANALSGKDLDPTNPEIRININAAMQNLFYLGTDGNCPPNQYDLESIILHEFAHGLGFISNDVYYPATGVGQLNRPTPFDAFAVTPDGSRLMDLPSPSAQLGQAFQNTLVWNGPIGIAANNGIKPVLFTPNPYQPGSSVSHLDQVTFQNFGPNALMTPSWPPGAVFRSPGPLVLGMLQDMRTKPPGGKPAGLPDAPRNIRAIVGDKYAIVNFDEPDNARTSPIDSYTVKVDGTSNIFTGTSSPIKITGLKDGVSYTFTVTATNPVGTSPGAKSNSITPQMGWIATVIDPAADAKYLATTTFQGKPAVIYSNSKASNLTLATWSAGKWSKQIIDGNSDSGGRTTDNVSGYISVCTSAPGKNQRLDIFYGDITKKWLRYAGYNGKTWKYSIVDGNGPIINDYKDINRVRTASDVSGASACVDTPDGLQVFYRDQSQGIILGAVQSSGGWQYELIDGDRVTSGRTTGDVGFHIRALNIDSDVYLIYDSVLQINQQKQPVQEAVRLATRGSALPEDWNYSTLDSYGGDVVIAGYDVGLVNLAGHIKASWMASTGLSLPDADSIRYADVSSPTKIGQVSSGMFGTPAAPMQTDGKYILFNCQARLCSLNTTSRIISLVTTSDVASSGKVEWINLGTSKYALAGINGKLIAYKLK